MKFCSDCGALMTPKKKDETTVFTCKNGHTEKGKASETTSLKQKGKTSERVEVVPEKDNTHLPTTKAQCPKCDHDVAHYWTVQTRAGDEPETKFMRCAKCNHTWRDYS